ncbi:MULTISPECIES: GNAT family N-acetyltransferase [unclassified Candidatus Tisiphia]|uniref:GNAT family N-acetyltransferase n=1 Tax=unclassified Candidatus Tisiphia TaxID=2996318 RepID=UPI00312CAA17
MNQNLTHRKATIADLTAIITLLLEDDLGQTREQLSERLDQAYIDAFHSIDNDPNQYLMIMEMDKEIVGTCHLTIMPSLTFIGSTRMQIEAVRVSKDYRGQHLGEWMMNTAMKYGKSKGVSIVQLTTNKKRPRAKQFYEKLGFETTHEGMKLYWNKESASSQ